MWVDNIELDCCNSPLLQGNECYRKSNIELSPLSIIKAAAFITPYSDSHFPSSLGSP